MVQKKKKKRIDQRQPNILSTFEVFSAVNFSFDETYNDFFCSKSERRKEKVGNEDRGKK